MLPSAYTRLQPDAAQAFDCLCGMNSLQALARPETERSEARTMRAVVVQAIAEVFLVGDCFSTEVGTKVIAETSGDFSVIEGCERGDISFGDASGSTDGSTAEGVRFPQSCRRFIAPVTIEFSNSTCISQCAQHLAVVRGSLWACYFRWHGQVDQCILMKQFHRCTCTSAAGTHGPTSHSSFRNVVASVWS